jgi:hypothetical protein
MTLTSALTSESRKTLTDAVLGIGPITRMLDLKMISALAFHILARKHWFPTLALVSRSINWKL